MKIKRLINKLERIINKNSIDTGFSWEGDPIACYCETIRSHLTLLSDYASKGVLTTKEMSAVIQCDKEITKTINEMLGDKSVEKYVKKYSTLFGKVVEQKSTLCATIKSNNSISTSFELALAERYLKDMEKIEKEEEKDFHFLERGAKSGKDLIDYELNNDQYRLVGHMKKAEDLNAEISGIKTTEDEKTQLADIQKRASKLCDSISLTVIDHYDQLNQIDSQVNAGHPLISAIDAKELRTTYESKQDLGK